MGQSAGELREQTQPFGASDLFLIGGQAIGEPVRGQSQIVNFIERRLRGDVR